MAWLGVGGERTGKSAAKRNALAHNQKAVFDQLLRSIGVKGASVEEVYIVDEDSLMALRPIYGLIFLFRWKDEGDPNGPETTCPEDIWFANQVIDNACASLALLNIVLNCEELEPHIGEHLRAFKEFTIDFAPPVLPFTLES